MAQMKVGDPVNFSNIYNSRALLQIDGFGETEFWVKEFPVPAFNIESLTVGGAPHNIKLPGNTFRIEDMSITFFVDENLLVYYRMYHWLMESIFGEYSTGEKIKKTARILVLNNQLTEVVVSFELVGAFIKGWNDWTFNNYGTDPLTMTVNFSIDNVIPEFKVLKSLGVDTQSGDDIAK
jgi:hypothetical protein